MNANDLKTIYSLMATQQNISLPEFLIQALVGKFETLEELNLQDFKSNEIKEIKYAKTKINFNWIFTTPAHLLTKYLQFNDAKIQNFGYYEYHTMLFDLAYRISEYWFQVMTNEWVVDVKTRDSPMLKEYLNFKKCRSFWVHPENPQNPSVPKQNGIVIPSFEKSSLSNWSEVIFTIQELKSNGTITIIETLLINTKEMVILMISEMLHFSEYVFKQSLKTRLRYLHDKQK